MIKTMYIGSGDVSALMSGLDTKAQASLMQKFVSGIKPHYNAKASPIDALRTGAILEDRYFLTLDENYYSQYIVVSEKMDVLKCSLDFAKLEGGKVVDFDELKTCNFVDILSFEEYKDNNDLLIAYIKKTYKKYYEQIQQQLFCTGLQSANLVFLAVYSYDDEENEVRNIQPCDYFKVRISRDEDVIEKITERAKIFQTIKDYYSLKIK